MFKFGSLTPVHEGLNRQGFKPSLGLCNIGMPYIVVDVYVLKAAVILNQTISIIVLAFISDDHAIFTLASSPQKYSEYFPM
jgi:hypothetical protein